MNTAAVYLKGFTLMHLMNIFTRKTKFAANEMTHFVSSRSVGVSVCSQSPLSVLKPESQKQTLITQTEP